MTPVTPRMAAGGLVDLKLSHYSKDGIEPCFYSKPQWSRWLNGQSAPPRKALQRLAEKLNAEGIDAGELISLWGRAFVPEAFVPELEPWTCMSQRPDPLP